MTAAELLCRDSVGLPRFSVQQAKAMVDKVRNERLLVSDPPKCEGRGIVIAGGGPYLSWAWVLCRHLRKLGCPLPIQVWHMGPAEMPIWAIPLFERLDAEPVDALKVMKTHPVRQMSGWILKNYAIRHCPWEQVVFLDADCFPSVNPEELMNLPEARTSGAFFFSDVANHARTAWAWVYCGLTPWKKEFEAGQYYVNKTTGWMGLRWSLWLNEHADVWYKLVHGDKDVTGLGFRLGNVPFVFSEECSWEGWGISQKWKGKEYFRHAMGYKRKEAGAPFPHLTEMFFEWETVRKR